MSVIKREAATVFITVSINYLNKTSDKERIAMIPAPIIILGTFIRRILAIVDSVIPMKMEMINIARRESRMLSGVDSVCGITMEAIRLP